MLAKTATLVDRQVNITYKKNMYIWTTTKSICLCTFVLLLLEKFKSCSMSENLGKIYV